jgi:hypothetical protein
LIHGIEIMEGDTMHLPEDTLRTPGTLIVPHPDTGQAYLYIQGTSLYAQPRPLDDLPGFTVFDSVPANLIPQVFSWTPEDTGTGTLVGKDVYVTSADTVATSLIPAPWEARDIGQTLLAGGAALSADTWVLTGSGADTSGSKDDFHFVYQLWDGDITLQARIVKVENTNPSASASLMIRDSLTTGSRHVNLSFLPTGELPMHYRLAPGEMSTRVQPVLSYSGPLWLRLERRGNLFEGFVSVDGATWELVGSQVLDIPTTFYAGLAVVSHESRQLCTAVIDSVSINAP